MMSIYPRNHAIIVFVYSWECFTGAQMIIFVVIWAMAIKKLAVNVYIKENK